jgi:hypothetical protein
MFIINLKLLLETPLNPFFALSKRLSPSNCVNQITITHTTTGFFPLLLQFYSIIVIFGKYGDMLLPSPKLFNLALLCTSSSFYEANESQ